MWRTPDEARTRRLLAGAVLALGIGGLTGACGSDGGDQARSTPDAGDDRASTTTVRDTTTTTAATTTEATTTTTVAPTTTTMAPTTTAPPPPPDEPPPPPAPPAGSLLRQGDSGEAVTALQNRLIELGYWVGEADGTYGQTTQQAVLAFQKAEDLDRDGVAGPMTQERLAVAGRVTASATSGDMIEIDLARQLLFVIDDGQVLWAFNTSTGASGTRTPPGDFTIDRRIDGYRHAELGVLYRPLYFNSGIAIHGYPSIPAQPASHGCTRVTNAAADWLWASGWGEIGIPVWVH